MSQAHQRARAVLQPWYDSKLLEPGSGLIEAVAAALEEEIEACAKVAESHGVFPELNVYGGGPDWYKHGQEIATAIRQRKGAR